MDFFQVVAEMWIGMIVLGISLMVAAASMFFAIFVLWWVSSWMSDKVCRLFQLLRKIPSWLIVAMFVSFPVVANASGYVFRDGYYWDGNTAYTRVAVGKYWDGRCWCPTYQYHKHHVREVVVAKVHEPFDEEQQIRELIRLKKKQLEMAHVQAMARELGLSDGIQTSGIASNYGYQIQSTYQKVPLAQQGSTQYGYSYSQQYIAAEDNRILLNQLGNALKGIQQIQGQALSGVIDVTKLQQEGAKEVALIQAAAQLVASTKSVETIQTTATPVHGGVSPQPQLPSQYAAAQSVADSRCITCHGSEKTEGGLNLTDYSLLSREQRWKIVDRVTREDDKRMPPDGELPTVEISAFLNAYQANIQ